MSEHPLEKKLDTLIRLTQDVFILQALKAGVPSHDVAALLKVGKERVSAISKRLRGAD
jgi:hypothetical protein